MINFKIKKISVHPEIWGTSTWRPFEKVPPKKSNWRFIIGTIIITLFVGWGVVAGFLYVKEASDKPEPTPSEQMFIRIDDDAQIPIILSLIEVAEKNEFDPKLVLAVAKLETRFCSLTVAKNNCFNIKEQNGYREYDTIQQSAEDFIDLIRTHPVYERWRETGNIEDLNKYAEDPEWVEKIKNIYNNL